MEQDLENSQAKPETQDSILLAALKLFADKGYFNTSLSDIAEASGSKSAAVLYQYFSNKQAIANALYENILDSLSVSIDDIRRRNPKSSDQLRSIVDLFFRLTDEAPYVMKFLLLLKTDEFLPEQKPIHAMPAFTKILNIIQNGVKNGEIKNQDPTVSFGFFFGVIRNTLSLVLAKALEKNADFYLANTWLAAWNTIAKK